MPKIMNRSDQNRIRQLTSPYSPFNPPRVDLEFGDFLSLLWQADLNASKPELAQYYVQCSRALARGLDIENTLLGRIVKTTVPGHLCDALENVPFRESPRLNDASARKAAIHQLVSLRSDVLKIGSYQYDWVVGWPGSGIADPELRERVFATLFTALRGQYDHFGRLILVIDIVLQEMMLGTRDAKEVTLWMLIDRYGYPDPEDEAVRALYRSEMNGLEP